ncbi:MAG: urate hydroxylase PuuD [Methylobacteriaceae bacterium]|nr:urate hydroxylase PuuD [Methylobacteriaceae bacterium]
MTWQTLLYEWANFVVRWIHVIAAIAWIGSSFYFVHLDLSLRRRPNLPAGVGGDAWQVHGGGFYHMLKYLIAPPHMPEELTWFKWEAYFTFLSGFLLLSIIYYLNADLYLIDKTVWDMPQWLAVALAIAALAGGWLIYDLLYRTPLADNDNALLAVVFALLVAAAFGLTKIFSGRGAFMELGAIIGTIMVANVAMNIMPNQRKTVAALLAGQTPNPAYGKAAKQRSLHNNYLTLPALFLMLSNHYPLAFATRWNWAIAGIVIVIGAVIRHFYNSRHAGKPSPWWTWGVAAAGVILIMWLSAQGPSAAAGPAAANPPAATKIAFAEVQEIVAAHCAMCHATEPLWPGIKLPPKGVLLDTDAAIRLHARDIGLQAVWSHAMPPGGNVSAISDDERAVLAAWLDAGAPAD